MRLMAAASPSRSQSQTGGHARRRPGLGLHPYFPRLPGASLRFHATGVWRNGSELAAELHVPVPPEWDHSSAKPVGSAELDNLFTGWDRRATVSLGDSLIVELAADEPLTRLVVYTPPGKDYFCVEPVSHMTDAINRPQEPDHGGLRILAPGGIVFLSG